MELWKVAETAHFFPALLVWLKQFGGHTVVASMRRFFFNLPIYQPNATIHVAKYTSPMDGMGTVIHLIPNFWMLLVQACCPQACALGLGARKFLLGRRIGEVKSNSSDFCLFNVIFEGFYHGRFISIFHHHLGSIRTIFSNHLTSKSKVKYHVGSRGFLFQVIRFWRMRNGRVACRIGIGFLFLFKAFYPKCRFDPK